MDNRTNNKKIIDIQVAQRKHLRVRYFNRKRILISLPFLLLGAIILNLLTLRDVSMESSLDETILGHFPYQEVDESDLILIEPNILVHKDMYASLLQMKEDAANDGIYLVFLSGFRSIELQNEIFYSLKSIRQQSASERARVSAPPGYSEHSTGFAIDIGDSQNRETDFEITFEETKAFKWLIRNASKYHFKMSFDKSQNSVDYEPWHWRYEGSIEALRIFENSNRS